MKVIFLPALLGVALLATAAPSRPPRLLEASRPGPPYFHDCN